MNSKLSLALVLSAALAGLALARLPQDPPPPPPVQDPGERLTALEGQVARLEEELALVKKQAQAAELAQELATTRALVDQLVAWAQLQSQAATAFETVLEDSRAKGFTFGINPESREVLLTGFHELAQSLKTGVPAPAVQPAPPAEAADARGRKK
jgi:hypothetical protein